MRSSFIILYCIEQLDDNSHVTVSKIKGHWRI